MHVDNRGAEYVCKGVHALACSDISTNIYTRVQTELYQHIPTYMPTYLPICIFMYTDLHVCIYARRDRDEERKREKQRYVHRSSQ